MGNSYLKNHIEDLVSNNEIGFSTFLAYDEISMAKNIAAKTEHMLWGCYYNAKRVILGVLCESNDKFPIICFKGVLPKNAKITHRDVLGALMSLKIKREVIGDIIVKDNVFYFFAIKQFENYLISNFSNIASFSFKLETEDDFDIDYEPSFIVMSKTVPSLRIDAVIGEMLNVSRNEANKIIESKSVFINNFEVNKPTKQVKKDDIIVIRKYGKFICLDCDKLTKKGRIIFEYKKYV